MNVRIDEADFWATLLWRNYLPQIESGAPFFLAADSMLIHAFAREEDPDIDLEGAVSAFDRSCLRLFDRRLTKAYIKDFAFRKVPSKSFSRVICLAVQQVLVVETMLGHDDFSERSYFPRYRARLEVAQGNLHENPIAAGFSRIWSTLRTEILDVNGATESTITFQAGTGAEVNRNLPMSQALLTRHDLSTLYQSAPGLSSIQNDASLLQKLHQARTYLNRRAQELISKSTVNQKLGDRLCEQLRSFIPDATLAVRSAALKRGKQDKSFLVVYPNYDDWLETTFCVSKRNGDGEGSDEPLNYDDLMGISAGGNLIAFGLRDDHYEQFSTINVFEPNDSVLILVRTQGVSSFKDRFGEHYKSACIKQVASNLGDEFQLFLCGQLPHSQLFDPFGTRSTTDENRPIRFSGGLLADARSNTFMVGYPPTVISHRGKTVARNALVTVNGGKTTVENLLSDMAKVTEYGSFLLQIGEDRIDLSVSRRTRASKPGTVCGYAFQNGFLEPSATILIENQPSLRGSVFTNVSVERVLSLELNITSSDVVLLLQPGKQIPLSTAACRKLVEAVLHSGFDKTLVQAAVAQIRTRASIPKVAISSNEIRKCLNR